MKDKIKKIIIKAIQSKVIIPYFKKNKISLYRSKNKSFDYDAEYLIVLDEDTPENRKVVRNFTHELMEWPDENPIPGVRLSFNFIPKEVIDNIDNKKLLI